MQRVSVFLALIVGALAMPQLPEGELPPPVIPQPRQVVPEPRQSSCRYSLAFSSVGQKALLQSPNWPSEYSGYADCTYTLTSPPGTVISLECTEFNVEASSNCIYDQFYFSLTGNAAFSDASRTCGRGTFTQTSTTNALNIGFKSDGGNPASAYSYRFQCSVTAVGTAAPAPAPTPAPATNTALAGNGQCGQRNDIPRIVGGGYAALNEFPWRCNLYSPNMGVFCGATVISRNWVVTAAHCTNAVPAGATVYVDCADHDISLATESENVLIKVSRTVQHPQYNKDTQDNDISLLRLETPLTFSKTIQPICLPYKMVGKSVNGLTVTASGWGTTSSGGSQSVILKKVDLPTLGTQECRRYYGTSVTANMICTYKAGVDTCQGDSGGSIDYKDPDTGKYIDLGVTSWGVGCAGVDQPGVYTNLVNYLGYIESTTGETFPRA